MNMNRIGIWNGKKWESKPNKGRKSEEIKLNVKKMKRNEPE